MIVNRRGKSRFFLFSFLRQLYFYTCKRMPKEESLAFGKSWFKEGVC